MPTVADTLTFETLTLANGATLLYRYAPESPRLSLNFYIPGGNLLDPVPGTMDLLDRLLLKGTTTKSQEQISAAIDGMTLELDVDTRRDFSLMHASLLAEDWDASLDLMADVFYDATFAEREREVIKLAGEIQMDLDSPKSRSLDLLSKTLFQGNPYGYVGSILFDALENLPDSNGLTAHYHGVYQPQRMIIAFVGNLPLNTVQRSLESHFPKTNQAVPGDGGWGEKIEAMTIHKDLEVTFARDDSNQAHIYKAWRTPTIEHKDYVPLVVMNTILGGAGLSSRMFVELRDKQGLAYHVRSSVESHRHAGVFTLYIGTEPKNKEKCLKGFIEECEKLMNTPVSNKELVDAKQNLLGRRAIFLETAAQQANYYGTHYVLGRTLADLQRLPDEIMAVTSADIQRVTQTYLAQPAIVSIVAPSSVL